MRKMINPYMVGELSRELAAAALENHGHIEKSMSAFSEMKKKIRRELSGKGHLHMAETLDTCSLCLLYHDDSSVKLKDEFYKRGVLVIDGYDFQGLDMSSVRLRLPVEEDFQKVLKVIKEINTI